MHSFQSFTADMLECSPFDKIGKEWMLVTAGNEEKVNTMTASWGGMGVMWGKNAVFVVIRQSRYTKEFIDREGTFSVLLRRKAPQYAQISRNCFRQNRG